LLDGAVVSAHPLLDGRTQAHDVFDLDREERTPVRERKHGTAIASLIVHGDLSDPATAPLPRRICTVPLMEWNGHCEELPADRLVVDLVYQAVLHLRSLTDADVLIINLSLGNVRRPFHGRMSPWARLLDWLAWEHGILFVVAAGNHDGFIPLDGYGTAIELEDDRTDNRPVSVLRAVEGRKAERTIISPAETVNGLTVGALNRAHVTHDPRRVSGRIFQAYPDRSLANPSSRLGPGFARSVKPDILMPGGREHLRIRTLDGTVGADPVIPDRRFGLHVAAPPTGTDPAYVGASGCTSGATALASRTAHRIHDALEEAYGAAFMDLPRRQRALVLKALLVHPAVWDPDAAAFILGVAGPSDPRQHQARKDNIRRYLGYGSVDPDRAVACVADRATFWATGMIASGQSVKVDVPIPACIGGKSLPHSLAATVAWFSPVEAGRQRYRAARLKLMETVEPAGLGVKAGTQIQPDVNQIHRGTTISRWWSGERAPNVTPEMTCPIVIQREPDLPDYQDEPIPFAIAVTLEMQGVVEIYDQVRQRLNLTLPIRS